VVTVVENVATGTVPGTVLRSGRDTTTTRRAGRPAPPTAPP
jgi:hypothetical protein